MFYNVINTETEGIDMTNNEKFNEALNRCRDPRRVYSALFALAAEPGIQQADDVSEKQQVIVAEVLALLDEAKRHQEAV